MITYYGYVLSPNQLETGEGFLICRNVPIARTGTQDYLASEVGKPGNGIIKVNRPEEEVFSAAALASFEGKPLTDDHPPVMLTPENVGLYEKGHVQNVRRGTGEWADFVVADIHVHDASTISQIQNGKRQISCGYEVEYVEAPDGTLTQTKIRGNHVALVDEARAGERARIMDSNTKGGKPAVGKERKKMSKKASFWHLFGAAAAGKTADEITELGTVMDAATEEVAPAPEGDPAPAKDEDYKEKLYETIDPKKFQESIDAMNAMTAKLDAFLASQMPKQEEPKDPIEAALETIENELKGEEEAEDETVAEGGEESKVVPAENLEDCGTTDEKTEEDEADCGSKDCGTTMDAATRKTILTTMRPVIAAMTDEAKKKSATDALLSALGMTGTKDNDAVKIAQAAQKNATVKRAQKGVDLDAVQALYDARNPHKVKKEA